MEQWSKEKLISYISTLEDKLSFYETKLKDLVTAYKSLIKEKEALELSVKALQNVCQLEKQHSEKQVSVKTNTVDTGSSSKEECQNQGKEGNFNAEVTTLMNSLATLSAEKCRMEALFQADKKLLRQEKEKQDVLLKDHQEKLKKLTLEYSEELEQLKSRLIIEKHERQKEYNNNVVMMSELQRLLSQEKEEKVNLEKKLAELTPKFQLLVNKEEVERYKEKDITEKFVYLQKQHLTVLEEERKRMLQAEQESKEQIVIHERRVANLETRLTELSVTVANYHRLRQEDQNEITKLKAHITELDSQTKTSEIQEDRELDVIKNGTEAEMTAYVKTIIDKIMKYKTILLNVNQYLEKSVEVNSILCDKCNSYEIQSVNLDVYRKLLNEYETLMQQFKESSKTIDEMENLKIKVQVLQERNIYLTNQLEEASKNYDLQVKSLQEQISSINLKHSIENETFHNKYKAQVSELEQQLQKQRNRTLALLDEKEQEVATLKSTFQIFLPGNKQNIESKQNEDYFLKHSQLSEVLDENLKVSSNESPHILHYAHELARRDVQITNLRKSCIQLETALHDTNKKLILNKEKSKEEMARLSEVIATFERCQTREGANIEYLKNVIVNYFLSQDVSSKRHMFNAIATILEFSDAEIQAIKNKL